MRSAYMTTYENNMIRPQNSLDNKTGKTNVWRKMLRYVLILPEI